LPGHDDVEGVFHPGAGRRGEGFGELLAVKEGFEGVGFEEGEGGEVGEEGGVVLEDVW